jgi:hypothetical protein
MDWKEKKQHRTRVAEDSERYRDRFVDFYLPLSLFNTAAGRTSRSARSESTGRRRRLRNGTSPPVLLIFFWANGILYIGMSSVTSCARPMGFHLSPQINTALALHTETK